MNKRISEFTKLELTPIVLKSRSFRQVLIELNKNPDHGSQNLAIKKRISELDIDISHFMGQGWNANNISNNLLNNKSDLDKILNNDVTIKPYNLKLKLYESNLKFKKCEQCGIEKWNGQDAPLELHHIDGNNRNNNLDNLQILCCNCHAQTHNWRRKNTRKHPPRHKNCIKCNIELKYKNLSGLCRSCFNVSTLSKYKNGAGDET